MKLNVITLDPFGKIFNFDWKFYPHCYCPFVCLTGITRTFHVQYVEQKGTAPAFKLSLVVL